MGKKGFTVGELLIVVAIIGVLVSVSIPVFAAQKKKAIIATNKANIRAAKAAGAMAYYDPDFKTIVGATNLNHAYFKYDVKAGTLENITGSLGKIHRRYHDLARKESEKARNYEVCDYIYIYVGESDKKGTVEAINVETAPYYEGNEVKMSTATNPFGWSK
ncbi:prepilin-type N-terminal cleavage/methylation domain-containing protein [Lachnospiraceae bacterium JC7]|nr:prepilin-type N-terminal cleavage/methylation domain-containing protein [Lachnospiraceae bacterium JC7]